MTYNFKKTISKIATWVAVAAIVLPINILAVSSVLAATNGVLGNENFNTVNDSTYKGISVGFNAVDFGTVSSVEVDMTRADGSQVSREGGQGVFDIISNQTTPQHLTAPFVINEGTFKMATDKDVHGNFYWLPPTTPTVWSNATKPVSVTISVTDENGTQSITNPGPLTGPDYASITPPGTPTAMNPNSDTNPYFTNTGFTQTWTDESSSGAVQYNYESCYQNVVPAANVTTCDPTATKDYTNTYLTTSKTVLATQPDSHFFWHVNAESATGTISNWSNWREITIDHTSPTISNLVISNVTDHSAQINWSTNEPTTAQANYGQTIAYGSSTALNSNFSLNHQADLANLTCGTTYYFSLEVMDQSGNKTDTPADLGNSFKTNICDVVAPVKPANLMAQAGDGQVTLNWDSVSDAAQYRVRFRDITDPNNTVYAYINMADLNPTLNIAKLANGTSYEFGVEAIDAAGNESGYSLVNATPVAPAVNVASSTITLNTPNSFEDLSNNTSNVSTNNSDNGSVNSKQGASDNNGKIKGQETERTTGTRSVVTFIILLLALAAGIGGYYFYEWWLSRTEGQPAGMSQKAPITKTNKSKTNSVKPTPTTNKTNGSKSKSNNNRRKNGRW